MCAISVNPTTTAIATALFRSPRMLEKTETASESCAFDLIGAEGGHGGISDVVGTADARTGYHHFFELCFFSESDLRQGASASKGASKGASEGA